MAIVDGQIRCCDCGQQKPVADFYPSIAAKGSGRCKACAKVAYGAARSEDPERFNAYRRASTARNPERAKAVAKKHREKKRDAYDTNPVLAGTIRCHACGVTKHVSEFRPSVVATGSGACRSCMREAKREYEAGNRGKVNAAKRARRARNVEHARASARAYWRRNPGKLRAYNLRRYGLTPDEYAEMLAVQGGACACCGSTSNASGKRLFVDHDHETGEIRGILCTRCNAGIGHLGDNIEGVRRALMYLEKHRPTTLTRPSVRVNLMEANHVGSA